MEGVESLFLGFLPYVVTIFLATGLFILLIDVKIYKKAGQKKEQKATLILGWINILMGLGVFLTNWIYNNYIW